MGWLFLSYVILLTFMTLGAIIIEKLYQHFVIEVEQPAEEPTKDEYPENEDANFREEQVQIKKQTARVSPGNSFFL